MPLSTNLRGALFMSLAMAAFLLNDTITKVLSADMNMGQIMILRGIVASALIFALAHYRGALRPVRLLFQPAVLLRIIGEAGAAITFLIALAEIPIANVTSIFQALPLAVTMGAALFLAEPVGWRRWSAIAVGFAGVMVIVRPGLEGFSVYSLLVLASVLFAALRDLATRMVSDDVPSLFLSALTTPLVGLSGLLIVWPLGGWSPVAPSHVAFLCTAAVLLLIGYQFIIMAMRGGADISYVAPFRYTSLVWSIAVGYLVFGDIPDVFMIAGAIIIVASGLYTLYRERARPQAEPIAAETLAAETLVADQPDRRSA